MEGLVRRRVLLVLAIMILTFNLIAVFAEEPNVGTQRVNSFQAPGAVAPSSVFSVNLDVEYALHGRPEYAIIRAAIYKDNAKLSDPLWQSDPENVTRGGDKIWNLNLTSPSTEGYLKLTAIAFYLDEGAWDFFNNTTNGPGFKQITVRVAKTANLEVHLGLPGVMLSIDDGTLRTDLNGIAEKQLVAGETHVVIVSDVIEYQNMTRIIFNGWNDGGKQPRRDISLDGDMKLIGSYRTQYLLQINSFQNSYAEWHDAGSYVEPQTPTFIPMASPLGLLGCKYNFVRWSGDINSTDSQIRLRLDAPKILNANYSIDYGSMFVPAAISVAFGTIILLLIRHRRNDKASRQEPNARCDVCGRVVERSWTFCNYCGTRLTSRLDLDSRLND